MNVIICVDDTLGMLFNQRRQSRDKVLIGKVMEIVGDARLLICAFSQSLFEAHSCPNLIVRDDFLELAGDGDFCFVENRALAPYADAIEKIFVFKWNRVYPSDFLLDLDLAQRPKISTEEFQGNSHEKITLEVYGK